MGLADATAAPVNHVAAQRIRQSTPDGPPVEPMRGGRQACILGYDRVTGAGAPSTRPCVMLS